LKSTGLKLPSLTSLKNQTQLVREEEKVIVDTGVRINKPFELSALKGYWMQYADTFKTEGKTSEYIILANRELTLEEDYTIKISLDNLVQVDQLNSFKPELLDFLRRKLSNSLIMLEISVMDKPIERKPYSQSEKLQHMIEKYPIVADLKKKLGLDMDY
jgi:DNA polymerase-3 subunit gamma/tau